MDRLFSEVARGNWGMVKRDMFHSLARAAMPMVKRGAKALGKIALKRGRDLVTDVLEGKNVKEAAKARTLEAANIAKGKAISQMKNQLTGQTGSGKRRAKKRKALSSAIRTAATKKRRRAKKRKASSSTVRTTPIKKRRTAKKRKASSYTVRTTPTKKRRTVRVADIFG
jgi:hypothetical protein